MTKPVQWLFSEIELWRSQGIIDTQQAQQIQALYQNSENPAWGKIIFAGIGSIIFGLGIILLFAYNWEAMHRFSKLAVVLLSLIAAQGAGFYFSAERSQHKKIGESLHLLGTMLFGAGIWLVAQIYHIDEHFPNALLVWALGALALAWILPSLAHTLLALGLIGLWHSFEVFQFNSSNNIANGLIVLGIIPLAWKLKSRSALSMTLALLVFTFTLSYINLADTHEETLVVPLFFLSGSFILASFIAQASTFSSSQTLLRTIGVSVFVLTLYICTFSDMDDAYFAKPWDDIPPLLWLYFYMPIVLALGITTLLLTRYRKRINNPLYLTEMGLIISVFTLSFLTVLEPLQLHDISWILYNFIFLAYSLLLIYRGTHLLVWQAATVGTLMLSAFTFARFMDLFDSLLMRALAFLMIGAMLFAVGFYYSNQKQKRHLQVQARSNPYAE